MFKKIYIEITNNCNLKCDFCIKNSRKSEFISIDKFKILLSKINDYTDYLYFHVLGEPLLHPKINELINFASNSFKINITTNGYLINRIANNKNIRQFNISLHSFDEKYGITLENYLENIFNVVDKIKDNTYISYRFWINNKYSDKILEQINKKYHTDLKMEHINNNVTLEKNVFISVSEEFIWPDLENVETYKKGKCYGLVDHIGILVDGTIVPCCLDSKGDINLGNIYESELNEIVNNTRSQKIINGFKENKKIEKLCQKCNFM